MQNILRYSLVTLLSTVLTVGPATAAHWMDCGCSSYEPVSYPTCGCETIVTSCGDCCTENIEIVSEANDCCGEEVTQSPSLSRQQRLTRKRRK